MLDVWNLILTITLYSGLEKLDVVTNMSQKNLKLWHTFNIIKAQLDKKPSNSCAIGKKSANICVMWADM